MINATATTRIKRERGAQRATKRAKERAKER